MAKLIENKPEYWLRMLVNDEKFIRENDVKTIIKIVRENGELESDDPTDAGFWSNEYHKIINGLAYQFRGNEYIITEDGKIFYWYTVIEPVEILDEKEAEERTNKKIDEEIDKGNKMRIVGVNNDAIFIQTKPYYRWNQYIVTRERFADIAKRFFPAFLEEFNKSGNDDMLEWFYRYGEGNSETFIFTRS